MSKQTKEKIVYTTNLFNDFNVYRIDDIYTFFYIEISDTPGFYESMFDYFFDDNRLLKYAENKSNLIFEPSVRSYAVLFKHLVHYIDDFNMVKTLEDIEHELLKIIADEYTLEKTTDGSLRVRLDKMGKIGEYIFCNLLSEYFHFDCIIPKVHLTTDPNMNVYGIDTLFYSIGDDLIMFGESKLSISLGNGIELIKKSLVDYEKQIKDEFNLILSNRLLKSNMGAFEKIYGEYTEISLNIADFIKKASITNIGIPIFIAHGNDNSVEDILKRLSKIDKKQFFGVDTKYYFISLPIINKSKFIATFTKCIAERRVYYENEHARL